MQWNNISNQNAVVFEARTNHMRITLVCGHIDYPHEWILSTSPDIFKGYHVIGNESLSGEDALKECEQIVRSRLNSMMKGMNAEG